MKAGLFSPPKKRLLDVLHVRLIFLSTFLARLLHPICSKGNHVVAGVNGTLLLSASHNVSRPLIRCWTNSEISILPDKYPWQFPNARQERVGLPLSARTWTTTPPYAPSHTGRALRAALIESQETYYIVMAHRELGLRFAPWWERERRAGNSQQQWIPQ